MNTASAPPAIHLSNRGEHIDPIIRDALVAYCIHRRKPGQFLVACLQNDFVQAATRADWSNRHQLHLIASWIFTYAPSSAWGDPMKVDMWLAGIGVPGFVEPGGESA